jgi:hypothetical protein
MTDDSRERIRSLLVKVGDERKKIVGNLRGSVAIMAEDMGEHRDTILVSLIECGKYLPTKSGVYGTWLALMNPDNRVFVSEAINTVYSELRYAVSDSNMAMASCLLRLLIECANAGCLSVSSLLGLLKALHSVGSDFGVHLLVSSLGWFSPELAVNNEDVKDVISDILSSGEALIQSTNYQTRKSVTSVIPGNADQLEAAIACVSHMQSNGWESEVLIRPYMMDGIALPVVDSEFVHSVPSDHSNLTSALTDKKFNPRVFYRSENDLAVSDRFLLEEQMSNTLDLFNLSVGECSKALLRIPVIHPSFESVLADVVISSSIGASMPGFFQSVMHRIMLLQESVRAHYERTVIRIANLPDLSPDAQFGLADLMAFSLINNVKLTSYSELPSGLMDKFLQSCLRLAPVNSIQAKLESVSLTEHEPAQGSSFEASDEYGRVREVVRIKDGSAIEVIEMLSNRMEDKEGGFALFVQALLENGSRTITHFTKLVDLYESVIQRAVELGLVGSIEQRELTVVSRVFAFWNRNGFRLEKTLDLLLHRGLLSVHSIVTCMQMDPQSLTTYRLIDLVVSYLVNRKRSLKKEIEESIVSESLTQQLGEAEYSLSVTVTTLLQNSPESVQKWLVRKYHADLDKSAVSSDILASF